MQVQKPMDYVQFDLAHQRITKFASVPSCGFDTDKNFAVVKSYDVRGTAVAEELEMQSRNAPVGDKPDKNSIQLVQRSAFAFFQSQTTRQSIPRELFQFGDTD